MTAETPLDAAFLAQEADPDPALRLRFHERVLDAELAVALDEAAEGDALRPSVYDLEDGRFVLAFDRDERLADFFGMPTAFAVLTGRRLAAMLAGQGTGIALNLGAPSATLLPAAAVDWLAAMVQPAPESREARLAELASPAAVPAALRAALAAKLAAMSDVVAAAHLASAGDAGEIVLVLTGVPETARAGVAAAVAEAVRFTDGAPAIDLTFVEPDSPGAKAAARAGLRLDLPAQAVTPAAGPGLDPAKPPKLR